MFWPLSSSQAADSSRHPAVSVTLEQSAESDEMIHTLQRAVHYAWSSAAYMQGTVETLCDSKLKYYIKVIFHTTYIYCT